MIGTDILAIARMQRLYQAHPKRVVTKILHPQEYEDFNHAKDKARFLAKRWASKEAIAKALGRGLRAPLVMPAIIISHDALGAPQVAFSHQVQPLLTQQGISKVLLSVSDEKDYVVAFVLAIIT